MAFATPGFTKGQVDRAGNALRQDPLDPAAVAAAMPIITNWRSAHAYPLNTFQATLRKKLKALGLDAKSAPVGQRLKRLPSIAGKLRRFDSMALSRMQDIAGLRAVVPTPAALRSIRRAYVDNTNFPHQLRSQHDYVQDPKDDGYRSIHLIYRYQNTKAPAYDGLHVELQLRTHLQHAWATAVETVDTFANQAIKAGRPTPQWAEFFLLASAAFAAIEGTPMPLALRGVPFAEIVDRLREVEAALKVILKLRGFSVAAGKIQRIGRSLSTYHLVVLDTERFDLHIESFAASELANATAAYADVEVRTASGEPLDAVLVAGGSVEQLRRTYPNYFLDASVFVKRIAALCNGDIGAGSRKKRGLARA
ncbi:RelA/SpoT domain-containing protein [Stenotrophomonas maltophilia]|nr:RelA/SpoT domain-containing protein [Stenotrophomonas maltophilia]